MAAATTAVCNVCATTPNNQDRYSHTHRFLLLRYTLCAGGSTTQQGLAGKGVADSRGPQIDVWRGCLGKKEHEKRENFNKHVHKNHTTGVSGPAGILSWFFGFLQGISMVHSSVAVFVVWAT